MVFDAFVDGCNVNFSCRYSGLEKFKCEVFKGWNEELGSLFEEKSRYLWDEKYSISKYFSFMELIQLQTERENGILGQKIKKMFKRSVLHVFCCYFCKSEIVRQRLAGRIKA